MSELQKKLEQYGFPKPDDLVVELSQCAFWIIESKRGLNKQKYHEFLAYEVSQRDQVYSLTLRVRSERVLKASRIADMNDLGYETAFDQRELKTDSDWQAVANFIRFLKGE